MKSETLFIRVLRNVDIFALLRETGNYKSIEVLRETFLGGFKIVMLEVS